MKICFAASSGGHLDELLKLNPFLKERHNVFIVTEKTPAFSPAPGYYYLHQVNRKEWNCLFLMAANAFLSLRILLKEKPDVLITTGALCVIPICLLTKLFGIRLIFIETVAVVTKPSRTGRFLYPLADRFYIQWKPLKKYYPKAICERMPV